MTVFPRTLHAHVPWPGGLGAPEESHKQEVPRREARYECAKGHTFTLTFAAGAEVPAGWDCRHCGGIARLEGTPEGVSVRLPAYNASGQGRCERAAAEVTPMAQLLKRRQRAELEAALAERMAQVRQSRVTR